MFSHKRHRPLKLSGRPVRSNRAFEIGRADKRRVTQAVIEKMVKHGFVGPNDLELVATGETRAENTITWGRNALKNRGLIARGSPRGLWELTEEGRAAAVETVLPKKAKRQE